MSETMSEEQRMAAGMAKHMTRSLESSEGGVAVTFGEGKYGIHFPYNPRLIRQVKEVKGAAFDKEAKIWTVPLEEYDAIRDAVSNMRQTLHEQTQARADMAEKIKAINPEANVKDAFTKDNSRERGTIVAVNDYFVAQDRGNGVVSLHDKSSLSEVPEIGAEKSIFYKKGRGIVQEPKRSQEGEGEPRKAAKRGAEASM